MIDWGLILKLIGALCSVAMVVGGLVKYLQGRHEKALAAQKAALDASIQANTDRIEGIDSEVKEALNGFGQRMQRVEYDVAHLPSKEDIGRLFEKLDDVNGSVQKVIGGQDALKTQVTMINDYLLKKKE